MRPCEICGRPGQKHHIIFRSQGGMNIDLNYAWLCQEHHTDGKAAVHNNRSLDLKLKIRLQKELEKLFPEETYQIGEVAERIGYNRRRLEKRMKAVPRRAGEFERTEIIRFLMGGKLYAAVAPADPEQGSRGGEASDGIKFFEYPFEGIGNGEREGELPPGF